MRRSDAPGIVDRTIVAWLDNAEALDRIHDSLFRQDTIGTLQGLTGLWQIFCRQGSIPADKADEALLAVITPFGAGRSGVNALLRRLLYWADVGDQMGVQPAQLNVLVPEWTQNVVGQIFASHLEDRPALFAKRAIDGRGTAAAEYTRSGEFGTGQEPMACSH
jgi:hypothetical protein